MKKILSLLIILTGLVSVISYTLKINANELSELKSEDIISSWDSTTTWSEKGAKLTLPGGIPDAWNIRAMVLDNDINGPLFSLNDENVISFDFSIGMYDPVDGSSIANSTNSSALDIHLMNALNDFEIMHLRIWTDTGGSLNGNHSYEIYPIPGNWGEKVEGNTWIKGDATLDSSFKIQFSKENLFESFVGGSDEITRLDNGNNDLLNHKDRLLDIDQVYFRISGDNGFNANVDLVVNSVNGQSLSNDNMTFVDTVSPVLVEGKINQSIPLNEVYELPVVGYDLLDKNLKYQILNSDGEVINDNGKSFTPEELGELEIKLVVSDSANNKTEKTYKFNVTSEINPPELTDIPVLEDIDTKHFENLEIPFPNVIEETGDYTLSLDIYFEDSLEVFKTITSTSGKAIKFIALPNFLNGEYTFVYKSTNVGGTVVSDEQTITMTFEDFNEADFITPTRDNATADYVDEGIRLRTTDLTRFVFGNFDLNEAIEIKYQIPNSSSTLPNDGLNGWLELVIMDPTNYNNYISYRVWLDVQGSPDSPTNIYIAYEDESTIDITESGWIDNAVDGVNKQFLMGFSLDELFYAQRPSGITGASKGHEEIQQWLERIDSDRYDVALTLHSNSTKNYFEMIVTQFNDQILTSTNGVIDEVLDAKINYKRIDEKVLLGTTIKLNADIRDLFLTNKVYNIEITNPDNEKIVIEDLNEEYEWTPEELGVYKIKYTTVGSNSNLVETSEIEIVVKDKVTNPIIELDGTYLPVYDLNTVIKILGANYSDDVNLEKISIKVIDQNGEVTIVKVGDELKLDSPGIYKIRYYAEDNALPESNITTLEISINVPDVEKPIVEVGEVQEKAKLNETIVLPTINVTDHSSYDILIEVVNPEGERTIITLEEFKVDKVGKWQLVITVTDIYDNITVVTKDINVLKNSNTVVLITSISAIVLLACGIGVFFFIKKRK